MSALLPIIIVPSIRAQSCIRACYYYYCSEINNNLIHREVSFPPPTLENILNLIWYCIIWIVSPGAYFQKGGLDDILAH